MKISVDVKRAEQSWDIDTGERQNYLVLDVFGLEVRAPCSEEALKAAIVGVKTAPAPEERSATVSIPPQAVPPTFVAEEEARAAEEEVEAPVAPSEVRTKARRLTPLKRARGDDAGIVQG